MSDFVWLGLFLFLLPFAVVPFLGAPYVPSKSRKLIPFLKSLGAKAGDTLVDLGSGDGTVLKHASKELNLNSVGIELNPFLVAFSRARLIFRRPKPKVLYGNIWSTKLPKNIDIVYAFIMPKHMDQLETKLQEELNNKTLVVTYSFELPGRKPFKKSNGFLAYWVTPLAKK